MQHFEFRSQLMTKRELSISLTNSMQHFRTAALGHGAWRLTSHYKEPASPLASLWVFSFQWVSRSLQLMCLYLNIAILFTSSQPSKCQACFSCYFYCLPKYDNTNKTYKPIPEIMFWVHWYSLDKIISFKQIILIYSNLILLLGPVISNPTVFLLGNFVTNEWG